MANFLGPYWVQINYHGAAAPHTMTVPTKNWNPGAGFGTFDTWASGTIAAETMIEALVDELTAFFNGDTAFDNWVIYKQLLVADQPQPVMSGVFTAMVGTDISGDWAGAVEVMIIARTAAFGLAKLALLDAVSGNDFNPILVPTPAIDAVLTEWTSDANGWSGRDNSRPNIFLKATVNLNQKLRKEYRLD